MLKRTKARAGAVAQDAAVVEDAPVVGAVDVAVVGTSSQVGGLGDAAHGDAASESADAARTPRASMRRINLLPPEIVQERGDARIRRRMLVALGGLVVVLVAVWLLTSLQGSSVRSELAAQKEANAKLERQIDADELQAPVRKQEQVDERREALATVLGQEVAFPRMLRELSRVMPPSMYIDSVDLSVPVQQAPTKKNSSSKKKQPTISIEDFRQELRLNARAAGAMDLSAEWLDRTKLWPAVNRSWLSDQVKVDAPTGGQEIAFTTSVELNGSILSERAQRLAKGELP